jgi:hypothetical protein
MGDSMMRQLFLRLVWYLRGLHEIVEHYFHKNARYAQNETMDLLTIDRDRETIQNSLFTLEFLWSPLIDYNMHDILSNNTIVVTTTTYWMYDTSVAIHAIQTLLDQHARIVYMATPYFKLKHKTFVNENAKIRSLFGNKIQIIPADIMDSKNVFTRNSDDNTHFQCSYLMHSDIQATSDQIKTPQNGDCRDWFNLNSIMLFLNSI